MITPIINQQFIIPIFVFGIVNRIRQCDYSMMLYTSIDQQDKYK